MSRAALLITLGMLSLSCLPNDTRPTPGKALVTLSSDAFLEDGIPAASTKDGWAITHDRVLVSIGRASVEGDSCIGYSDPDYTRVLALPSPAPQKVNEVYAIGHCDLDFELSSPHADSVLGKGATEADKAFLRTPVTNPYAAESGVSLHVRGHATKNGVVKRFSWAYLHRIDFASCGTPVGGGRARAKGFDLASRQSIVLDLVVHGDALFHDQLDPALARLAFQPLADADTVTGDADGEVTLDELDQVPLTGLPGPDSRADGGPAAAAWTTLGDFVYLGLFPRMITFQDDGECDREVFQNDRQGH